MLTGIVERITYCSIARTHGGSSSVVDTLSRKIRDNIRHTIRIPQMMDS